MTSSVFETIEGIVLNKMDALDPHLYYHCKAHTMDVLHQSIRIAALEGIVDEKELFHLKFAALFHDMGFIKTYANHEAMGCNMFVEIIKGYHFLEEDITCIQDLIMATKVPQNPQTHLQKIICDADLDYLGRVDFIEIASRLLMEQLHYKLVASKQEWEDKQLIFLNKHRYHTQASQTLREPVKQLNISRL